ncbi:MAG: DegT/DnrJ/EryC1/StrS family aminotransferase [Victivallales bacterium]|nr:DegT/DnrJ/EryC1/StrS family aminotransferase [Victivallales bacterium]
MQVPLLDLKPQYRALKEEIMAEIGAICDSQMFILGEKVQKFEAEIAQYCHSKHACGVTSGSDALIISLMVEGIGPGDEVITSPFTFFATVGAICRVGATPVFADIDPVTFNLDPAQVAAKITPRTRAIIPVHLFGQCVDMDPLLELARKHNLIVVEDACQAIGAEYKGRRAGSIGDYGCFSFFPSKNLGGFGDGGIVTVNDDEKNRLLRVFRNHGMDPRYYHHFIGGNFRLDALQAVVLSVKLKYLDDWTAARQRNAAEYGELFAAAGLHEDRVVLPAAAPGSTRHVYNQFSIRIKGGRRDAVKQVLHDAGVGCDIYYPVPLHEQECFRSLGYRSGDMPHSEQAVREVLAIPIYPESTLDQRQYVVATIKQALS